MKELIATLLAWIAVEVGVEVPEPPLVDLVAAKEIDEWAFGRDRPRSAKATALYDRGRGIIYLNEDWSSADLRDQSTLLHELVHHIQESSRVRLPCIAARERLAYDLQLRWLGEQDILNPYTFLDINEFAIGIASMCPASE